MAFRHFLMAFRPKQNVVVAIYGVSPLTFGVSSETNEVVAFYGVSPLSYGVSPETDVVVAIYGVSPLTFGVSSETNEVVAIYGVSPLSYGVSPETYVVEIIYLLRYAVYFLRFAQNIRSKNHLLIALRQLPSAFRPKHT